MAEKLHVRPVRPPLPIAHPVDGPLAQAPDAKGIWSFWTQDQYTFQLLRDGDIERVPCVTAQSLKSPEPSEPPAQPARKKEPR